MKRPEPALLRIVAVLACTQLVGWGSISLPPVIGRDMAADLGLSLPLVFAGSSLLYITMGLCAPLFGRAFLRFGAKRVMLAGTLANVPGFLLLATAQGPLGYGLAWLVLGIGGGASLSTAAYVLLNEVAGPQARGAIGLLMLATGLSSSIFWPITAALAGAFGWRATCLAYALIVVVVSLPLVLWGLPARRAVTAPAAGAADGQAAGDAGTLLLLAIGTGLCAFVTFGLGAVLVELLRWEGLSPERAILVGSSLGVIQVSARGLDLLGGGRWDALSTGLVAGLCAAAALLVLMAGGGMWTIGVFLLLYGLGSGALTVARATMPMVFYDRAAYARAMSRIALPLNLMSAFAPAVMAATLQRAGGHAVLALGMAGLAGALIAMALLTRRRPRYA